MTKTNDELAVELTALRTLIGQQHDRLSNLEARIAAPPTPPRPKKKRKVGTNTYMYWCNNMGMREKIRDEHAQASSNGSVDMKAVVSDLGKRWKALPEEAKNKVKKLCDDHNKKLRDADATCA